MLKFKSFAMPLIFLGVLAFSFLFCSYIPYNIKSFLYAISLSIKEILVFLLPFIIFILVSSSIKKLGSKAIKYIAIIVPLICCSNFINTMLSYFFSFNLTKLDINFNSDISLDKSLELKPFFTLSLDQLFSNDNALIYGALFGFICAFVKNKSFDVGLKLFDISTKLITKIFFKLLIPIMPFFIMGTALKLQNDGILSAICSKYLPVLVYFVMVAYGMVILQYLILSKFKLSVFYRYIKNVFPAAVTAFGSMSSAAALPISIKAAENNLDDKNNAGIIVPSSVNIHLVGDCFFIPMITIAVMVSFGMTFPSIWQYFIFALRFVLGKFAVAAIPGGGIIIMIPIIEKYLGLSSDMIALVTALYILFDSVITACNVFGNGALAIIFEKLAKYKKT